MEQDIFELPGPEGKALVGNLLDLSQDPLGFLTHCAREYGDIVPMRLGLTPTCLLTHPDLMRKSSNGTLLSKVGVFGHCALY
ncbi:cytochrome P450 [Gloeocapsa sp. BRSZ]